MAGLKAHESGIQLGATVLYPMVYRGFGRARILAGRIASPIDEDSIPPVVIRPARSRALPCDG
jgi:hypothetical protein